MILTLNVKKLNLFFIAILLIALFFYCYNNTPILRKFPKHNSSESRKIVEKFYKSIKEEKFFSQNKEDGVILSLISLLNLPMKGGKYVEFGTESGKECNTRYLRENLKWTGLLMDGYRAHSAINLHREIILYSNVIQLFKKYNVSKEFDLFSEDTDYADYWIVKKVVGLYRPKLVIHEVNQKPPQICVTVPKPNPKELVKWKEGSSYHGGSVCAFYCLAKTNGYSMVYCESSGVNCFWVRNDLLETNLGVDISFVQNYLNPVFLYRTPKFVYRESDNSWHYISC